MQPSQLNAAQLMMSFLSKEHGKLGQKIVASEFSNELKMQNQELNDSGVDIFSEPRESSRNDGKPRTMPGAHSFRSESDAAPKRESVISKTSAEKKLSRLQGTSERPLQISKERIKENLLFINPVVVDQIMAQLRLPAEARQAVKDAEDSLGRISIKAITTVLNNHGNSESASSQPAQTQPRIAARDVRELIDSLSQVQGESVNPLRQFGTKSRGYYSPDEFKQLLENIAQRVRDQKVGLASTTDRNLQTGLINDQPAPVEIRTPDAVPAGLVQRLTESLIPGFSKDDFSHVRTPGQSSPFHIFAKEETALSSVGPYGAGEAPASNTSSGLLGKEGSPQPQVLSKDSPVVSGPAAFEAFDSFEGNLTDTPSALPGLNQASPGSDMTAGYEESEDYDNRDDYAKYLNGALPRKADMPLDANGSVSESLNPSGDYLRSLASGGWTNRPEVTLAAANERVAEVSADLSPEEDPVLQLSDDSGDIKIDQAGSSEGHRISSSRGMNSSLAHSGEGTKDQGFELYRRDGGKENLEVGAKEDSSQSFQADFMQAVQPSTPVNSGGDGPVARLSLQHASWPYELSDRLRELQQQKRQYLTLELEPQHLGRMVLRIEAEKNQVTAWVSTSTEQVRTLLAQNAPMLRELLQEQGLMLGQFFVDVREEKGGQHSSYQQQRFTRRQNGNSSKTERLERSDLPANQARYRQDSGERLISVFA